MLAAKWKA